MNRAELLDEAIARWGWQSQALMAVEEMAELTQAISKVWRLGADDTGALVHLIDELVDARIMLDQMVVVAKQLTNRAGLKYEVETAEQTKLIRLARRLGVGYSEATKP